MERVILHCDLNNFFASVEERDNPSLAGKHIAVCGDPQKRHGIVLAKNEKAKACDVKTGEALWEAKRKCPELVFVAARHDVYVEVSRLVRDIYYDYTDQIESFGIDECWLDVTGSLALFGSGEAIANDIRRRIREELGVTVSVGVSFNKIFAKLGSDLHKPDKTTLITRENFKDTVWPLPASNLLYVGRATYSKLLRFGIKTIGEIANTDPEVLRSNFGKHGVMLWQFANGFEASPVRPRGVHREVKSIGNSVTTPRDLKTDDDVRIMLWTLCESVAARLRESSLRAAGVSIYIRDYELESFERQIKLTVPVCTSAEMFKAAYSLYLRSMKGRPIRTIGVRAAILSSDEMKQLSVYPEIRKLERHERLEQQIDQLAEKYGKHTVARAITLTDARLSDIDPKTEHVIHPAAANL